MSKLYVCEKPDQAKKIQKIINEEDRIILAPTFSSYRFKFDRNIEFKNLPIFGKKPILNQNISKYQGIGNNSDWFLHFHSKIYTKKEKLESQLLKNFFLEKRFDNNSITFKKVKKETINFIKSFDEIVFACDNDHTGVRGFDYVFKYFFEIENLEEFSVLNNIIVTGLHLITFDEKSLIKAIKNKENYFISKRFSDTRSYYIKKDYFEYNYSLNSIMLFNKAYFMSKKKYPDHTITKNIILVLFYIQKLTIEEPKKKIKEVCLLYFMNKNKIGSAGSIRFIINNMIEMDLITKNEKELTLNDSTKHFLSLLHRKTNDPYLSQRILNDIKELSVDDFKIKYDNYLKVVFGKQKRFLNKNESILISK